MTNVDRRSNEAERQSTTPEVDRIVRARPFEALKRQTNRAPS
jgi:hypothetical protein